jgi:GTP-binding protein LepA
VIDGVLRKKMKVRFMAAGQEYEIEEVGAFTPKATPLDELGVGDVGFITAGIKKVSDAKLGDTITEAARPTLEPFPGFKELKPMVFAGLYPVEGHEYPELRDALEKLRLNDASFFYEPESSSALGFGFRCGFLGLLHLEVVQERLEREYDQSIIMTAPSVRYKLKLSSGAEIFVDNPSEYPDPARIESAEEPYIKAQIITPLAYIGNLITLCIDKRGVQTSFTHLDEKRVELVYEMPLADVLFDFYDKLKSTSRGYASFDYDLIGYRPTKLSKLDILINDKAVDALSQLVYEPNAYERARKVCERLQGAITRQQFKIAIQGAIGSRVIARETINPLRKDVLAKCYGGDISRKHKLLEKQKAGKKRMKMVGDVELPQEAFLAVLRENEEKEQR